MDAFIDTLKAQRDGLMASELEHALRELVEAVKATGKAGKLQITLKLTPHKGGVMLLEDDFKLSCPQTDKDTSTVFFPTDTNDLSRRDPRQPSLLPDRPRIVAMPQAMEGAQS